jgi:hypothetical protein
MPLAPEGWCECWCGIEDNGACSYAPPPRPKPPASKPISTVQAPSPTPTPAAPACTPSGFWGLGLWMGRYPLSWDGCRYHVDLVHPIAAAE